MKLLRLMTLLLIAVLLTACSEQGAAPGTAENEAPPLVIASNYPLYFFATRLAGDAEGMPRIVLPEMEGDPAHWKPGAEQISLLQSADAVLLNGAGYESWLDWVTLDEQRLFDTTAAQAGRLLDLRSQTVHRHGPEGEHAHEGQAFTTWLDPGMAAVQATVVAQVLTELAPGSAAQVEAGLAELQARLAKLDRELEAEFTAMAGRPWLFSHPVYQYLERRYGLDGYSLHWEPDTDPGQAQWIELSQLTAAHPATVMVWEDEPLPASIERLQEAGIQSIVFSPMGNRPGQGDYFDGMQQNLEALKSLSR